MQVEYAMQTNIRASAQDFDTTYDCSLCSLRGAFSVQMHEVWNQTKRLMKIQTSYLIIAHANLQGGE